MAKRSSDRSGNGTTAEGPAAPAARMRLPLGKLLTPTAGAVVALLATIALSFFLLGPSQPALIQRGLAVLCAVLALTAYLLATRSNHANQEMLARLRRGQHADFGKVIRSKPLPHRKAVDLPVIGEISVRSIVGTAVFLVVFLWWLTPWAPVGVARERVEDLTGPLGERIIACELVAPDGRLVLWQPPIILPQTRAAANRIDDNAPHYQLALRAIVRGRHEEAGRLLALAMREGDAEPGQINIARAQNELFAGRFDQAATEYHNALTLQSNDIPLLCQAAVAWLHAGNVANAVPLAERAVQQTQNKSPSDMTHGMALHVRGLVALAAGSELATAEQLFRQAQDAWKDVLPPDHPLLAASRNNQGMVYLFLGRYRAARELVSWGRENWNRRLGSEHPLVAMSLDNTAMVLLGTNQFDDAERELGVAGAALGKNVPKEPFVPDVHRANRGALLTRLARWPVALGYVTTANTNLESSLGTKHVLLAGTLRLLGDIHQGQSLYAKGEAYYFRALSIVRHTCGEDHPYAALIELDLAQLNLARGRHESATDFCRHALHALRLTLGDKHAATARALLIRGQCALAADDSSLARRSFDEAGTIAASKLEEDHPLRARIATAAASLEDSPRTYKRGVLQYERAIDALEVKLGKDHPEVAAALLGLARLYLEVGQVQDAGAPLQRCYAILKERTPPFHPTRAEALETYAQVIAGADPPQTERAAALVEEAAAIRRRHLERDQVD